MSCKIPQTERDMDKGQPWPVALEALRFVLLELCLCRAQNRFKYTCTIPTPLSACQARKKYQILREGCDWHRRSAPETNRYDNHPSRPARSGWANSAATLTTLIVATREAGAVEAPTGVLYQPEGVLVTREGHCPPRLFRQAAQLRG